MADGLTPNYGLTKPEVGGSDDTWGDKTNQNWDIVDAKLKEVSDVADAAGEGGGGGPGPDGDFLPLAGGTLTGKLVIVDNAENRAIQTDTIINAPPYSQGHHSYSPNSFITHTHNTDHNVAGFQILHDFGGPGFPPHGQGEGLHVEAVLDRPIPAASDTGASRTYTGASISLAASAETGGTALNPKGSFVGISAGMSNARVDYDVDPNGIVSAGAIYVRSMVGISGGAYTYAGTFPFSRIGVLGADQYSAVQATSNFDAAFAVSAGKTAAKWKYGLLFAPVANAPDGAGAYDYNHTVVSVDGTLIGTLGAGTVAKGIDWSSYTFSGNQITGNNWGINSTGGAEFGGNIRVKNTSALNTLFEVGKVGVFPAGTNSQIALRGAASGSLAGSSVSGFADDNFSWSIGNYSSTMGGAYDATLLLYQPQAKYRINGLAAGYLQVDAAGNISTGTPSGGGGGAASSVTVTPAGNIASTNVQLALQELDTEKVAKAGDTMTGDFYIENGTNLRTQLAVGRSGTPAAGATGVISLRGASSGTGAGTAISGADGGSFIWGVGDHSAVVGGIPYDSTLTLFQGAGKYRLGSSESWAGASRLAAGALQVNALGDISTGSVAREKLLANRDYFIQPITGLDTNNGLATGTPFQTIQKAINVCKTLDMNGFDVFIRPAAAGAFTYGPVLVDTPFVGGKVSIIGDNTTPSNFTINGAGATCVDVKNPGSTITVAGVRTTSSGSGTAFSAGNFASLNLDGRIDFGPCGGFHCIAGVGAAIQGYNKQYIISGACGNGYGLFYASDKGFIEISLSKFYCPTPVLLSAFCAALTGGLIRCWGMQRSTSATFPGPFDALNLITLTAPTKRFNVGAGGMIETSMGGLGYLPGTDPGVGTNFGVSPFGFYS